jgi:hypothetical protein
MDITFFWLSTMTGTLGQQEFTVIGVVDADEAICTQLWNAR